MLDTPPRGRHVGGHTPLGASHVVLLFGFQNMVTLERASLALHALITSRLDYCNASYVGLPLKTVWKLQLVQNRAARLLTGNGQRDHIMPVLFQLHWLPVWAQIKVLVLTFRALNGLGPGYVKERLLPYVPAWTLRSSSGALLREPLP